MTVQGNSHYPFGAPACEHEITTLQDLYPEYFYSLGRYTREAMDVDNYLFVGRRGSGKTSLTKYFHFQDIYPGARWIDVNEDDIYEIVLKQVATLMATSDYQMSITPVDKAARLWRFILWALILNEYSTPDDRIHRPFFGDTIASQDGRDQRHAILEHFRRHASGDKADIIDEIEKYFASDECDKIRNDVVQMTRDTPLIIAVDSVERYEKNNEVMMATFAGLIQCASDFNINAARDGIHVKVFFPAEMFPYLKEQVIRNVAKHIRNPVYLLWRSRDLVHMISWRFWKFLISTPGLQAQVPTDVDWTDFERILETLWYPYFGAELTNGTGLRERTFPYLLRHTQMRPRQLVQLCNGIVRQARIHGLGLNFTRVDIPQVVRSIETEMADEVINSYSAIYPQVSAVIDSLHEIPITFKGNELDKVARKTRSAWPHGEYSLEAFRALVVELGIVGKIRHRDRHGPYIIGDFDYTMTDHLPLSSDDDCVVHPMFYEKLHVKWTDPVIVWPVPEQPDSDFGPQRWAIPTADSTGSRRIVDTSVRGYLSGPQIAKLQEALLDAFDDQTLQRMVRIELNQILSHIAGGQNLADVVFHLIEWSQRNRRLTDLMNGALSYNPKNEKLQEVIKMLSMR